VCLKSGHSKSGLGDWEVGPSLSVDSPWQLELRRAVFVAHKKLLVAVKPTDSKPPITITKTITIHTTVLTWRVAASFIDDSIKEKSK